MTTADNVRSTLTMRSSADDMQTTYMPADDVRLT